MIREKALQHLIDFFDEMTGKQGKLGEEEPAMGEEAPAMESSEMPEEAMAHEAPEMGEESEMPSPEVGGEKVDVKKLMEKMGRYTPKAKSVEMGFIGLNKKK